MKKILSVFMALALSLSLFTACGSKEETASYDVNEVLTKFTEKVPVTMALEITTAEELSMAIGVNAEDIASFAAQMSGVNVSVDTVVVVEAVDGKVDAVKEALEAYKNRIADQMSTYVESEYQKALNGRIVVKGNYVMLAIAGDSVVIMDNGADEAYKPVDEAIEAAFN